MLHYTAPAREALAEAERCAVAFRGFTRALGSGSVRRLLRESSGGCIPLRWLCTQARSKGDVGAWAGGPHGVRTRGDERRRSSSK